MSISSTKTQDEQQAAAIRKVRLQYWQNRLAEAEQALRDAGTPIADFTRLTQARSNALLRIKNLTHGH